eukprot:scaffold134724_cov56-Attheya_sp.AAC.3
MLTRRDLTGLPGQPTAVLEALCNCRDKGLVYGHLRIGNPRALKSTTMNIEVNVLIELEARIYLGNQAFRARRERVPAIGLRLDLILPCESDAGKKGICELELDVIIWDTGGSGECGWMVHTQMFSGTHPQNNIFTSSFGVFIDPKGLGSLGAAIKAPCTKQTEEFWFMCAHPTNQHSLVFTLVPRQQGAFSQISFRWIPRLSIKQNTNDRLERSQ